MASNSIGVDCRDAARHSRADPRHSREGGNPKTTKPQTPMDSRLRGNDEVS